MHFAHWSDGTYIDDLYKRLWSDKCIRVSKDAQGKQGKLWWGRIEVAALWKAAVTDADRRAD